MSKVITDENQLNTEVDDLITEDYALEVLGLKNPADFRKFSRSFMKLSKIVKGIENVSNKVANKTELGRVKIGDNLTITEDGVLSGNPEYTHPVGAGYKHIPAGGTTGQVLKNNGDGSAEWGTLDIKDKLDRGNLPATIPDGKTIYDLLENNGGINIDTALLYLNDAGTKTQGKVYFDRNKKGLFECIQTTTSTTNSTTYFVDISNKANSDRFGNLQGFLDWDKKEKFIINAKNKLYTYTVKKQGMFFFQLVGFNYGSAYVSVNNVNIIDCSTNTSSETVCATGSFPVDAGDIIEYKTGSYANFIVAHTHFVPFK